MPYYNLMLFSPSSDTDTDIPGVLMRDELRLSLCCLDLVLGSIMLAVMLVAMLCGRGLRIGALSLLDTAEDSCESGVSPCTRAAVDWVTDLYSRFDMSRALLEGPSKEVDGRCGLVSGMRRKAVLYKRENNQQL